MVQEQGDSKKAHLSKKKCTELKELCREKGIKVTGKKSELVTRLTDYSKNVGDLSKEVRPQIT